MDKKGSKKTYAVIRGLPGIEVVTFDTRAQEIDDPWLDAYAHIPYRQSFLIELSYLLARILHAKWQQPVKVLAVDCDNTLWGGSCAELGPNGIDLSLHYRAVQRFMVSQCEKGRLICLVSHNSVEDVLQVLNNRRSILRPKHIVLYRMSWRPKTALVREVAKELGVGLDSVVFIDDNPLERTRMVAELPEVRTIELPSQAENVPDFLFNCWSFDVASVTAVDSLRTRLYQEEFTRRNALRSAKGKKDFVENLNVLVKFQRLEAVNLARSEQLAARTNQFTTTTHSYSAGELMELQQRKGNCVWLVNVSDKIGDYGQVGLVIAQKNESTLLVEAAMLSCRVLGRGVEGKLLQHIAREAEKRCCQHIKIKVEITTRNEPAQNLIRRIGGESLIEKKHVLILQITPKALRKAAGSVSFNS